MNHPRRYALIGAGARAVMYLEALAGRYRETGQLVALADVSRTRLDFHNRQLQQRWGHRPVPTYHADEFDTLVRQTRPDVVIITSVDCTHHLYTIRAMELGCDVICEKPITTDAEKLNAIFAAIRDTGRSLRITFNFRYAPIVTRMRELIAGGAIGQTTAVDLSWVLDTSHGADYFRRWHRLKDRSGGLLVHKASHHFDAINWWIDSYPQRVHAMGDLRFYGRRNAERRGESYPYDRYTGHPEAGADPFCFTLDQDEQLRGLYLEAEADSGYIRDRNVFNDDITIEDTMAITARYRNGVILNYSLIAYSPWEGVRVAITGTRGRIEMLERRRGYIIRGQGSEPAAGDSAALQQSLRVFPMFGLPRDIEIPRLAGSHEGSDPLLLDDLFLPDPPPDPLRRAASHLDGAAAVLLGISANQSIESGLPVDCDRILQLPEPSRAALAPSASRPQTQSCTGSLVAAETGGTPASP